MANFRFLFILLLASTLQSCFGEDELPTSGENSFTAKLNGKQFIAEDVDRFASISYGIQASVHDKNWLLTFSNSSDLKILISLHQVEEAGNYDIGTDELFFFDGESTISSVSVRAGEAGREYHTYSPE